MLSLFLIAVTLSCFLLHTQGASFNPAYVCSACVLISGLIEESAQYHLVDYIDQQCASTSDPQACSDAAKLLLDQLLAKIKPEIICGDVGACKQECNLFSEWPLKNIPDAQPVWPTERRKLTENSKVKPTLAPLLEVFQNIVGRADERDSSLPFFGHMALAMAELNPDSNPCGMNFTCHALAFGDDHLPFFDHDGDKYSPPEAKRLRYVDHLLYLVS